MGSRLEHSSKFLRVRDRLIRGDKNMKLGSSRSRRLLIVIQLKLLDDVPSLSLAIKRADSEFRSPSFKLSNPVGNGGVGHDNQGRTCLVFLHQNAESGDNLNSFSL